MLRLSSSSHAIQMTLSIVQLILEAAESPQIFAREDTHFTVSSSSTTTFPSAKTPLRNIKRSTLFSLTATGDFEELGSHEQEMEPQYFLQYNLVFAFSASTHKCTIGFRMCSCESLFHRLQEEICTEPHIVGSLANRINQRRAVHS